MATNPSDVQGALEQIATLSKDPDDWEPYDSWGDMADTDASNNGDVRDFGYRLGLWSAAKIARAALRSASNWETELETDLRTWAHNESTKPSGANPYLVVLLNRAAAALRVSRPEPAPERHDCNQWRMEGLGCAECNPIARDLPPVRARPEPAPDWRTCPTHPDVDGARMWGCPDCVVELRREVLRLRARPEPSRDARRPPEPTTYYGSKPCPECGDTEYHCASCCGALPPKGEQS